MRDLNKLFHFPCLNDRERGNRPDFLKKPKEINGIYGNKHNGNKTPEGVDFATVVENFTQSARDCVVMNTYF